MSKVSKLRPDKIVDSIYQIDLEELKQMKIRAVIADLDNTLIPWNSDEIDATLRVWVHKVKTAGLKLAILSNSFSLARVEAVSAALDVMAVSKAIKPRRLGFRRIAARLSLDPSEVAVVGDQLFTDIFGGNRAGMYTILVAPMSRTEFIGTRIVRRLEHLFLRRVKNKAKGGKKP